jgi:hypothetical protein
MKIKVLTFYHFNYLALASKTNENHLAYCYKHDYVYTTRLMSENLNDKSGYQILCIAGKVNAQLVLELLEETKITIAGSGFANDYVFTIGCDAIITNMDRKLEAIIEEYRNFDIVTGSDKAGINTSQMLIKNTEQSRSYFKHMLKAIENGCEHDQRYMWDNPKDFICPAPQWVMNSYDTVTRLEGEYDAGNWQAGDFLVHLAGMTLEQRMGVVDQWLGKVKQ